MLTSLTVADPNVDFASTDTSFPALELVPASSLPAPASQTSTLTHPCVETKSKFGLYFSLCPGSNCGITSTGTCNFGSTRYLPLTGKCVRRMRRYLHRVAEGGGFKEKDDDVGEGADVDDPDT